MPTYRGTVRDNVVVLPDGVDLPDGQQVEIRPISSESGPAGMEQPQQVDPEEEFLQYLLETGVISEIKRPGLVEPPGDRRPIKVRGKPVSEMIIEERR